MDYIFFIKSQWRPVGLIAWGSELGAFVIEAHHHHSDDILEPKTDRIVFHNFLPIGVPNEELIEQS